MPTKTRAQRRTGAAPTTATRGPAGARRGGERVETRHPDPAKQGTRIERWKYDAVRRAILKVVPRRGDGLPFRELPERVREALRPTELDELGSVGWYVTTIKLDLEARGEIARVEGARPQRLRRS